MILVDKMRCTNLDMQPHVVHKMSEIHFGCGNWKVIISGQPMKAKNSVLKSSSVLSSNIPRWVVECVAILLLSRFYFIIKYYIHVLRIVKTSVVFSLYFVL